MKFEASEMEGLLGVRDRAFVSRENRRHSMKFEANNMERLLRVRDRDCLSRENRRHSMKFDEMERLCGVKDRMNKRVKTVNKTIKQFKKDIDRCKEKMDRTCPGPAQDAVKDRAKNLIKEKRWYEGQRDMLLNQALKLDRVIFASKGIKDAQQTVSDLKELNGMMKNFQDDMMGVIDGSNEILESLGGSHNMPDHDIDEEDLMHELEFAADEVVSSYPQPKNDPDLREPSNRFIF